MSNIFGGNTGLTYADIQKKRGIAEKLLAQNKGTPQNGWEGANAVLRALMARSNTRKADKAQAGLVEQLGMDNPIVQKLLGVPGYRLGTSYHPGGAAVVGENGPELLNLPRGSQVTPNLPPDRMLELQSMTPEDRAIILQQLQGGTSPDDAFTPDGYNPIEAPQSNLLDDRAVQVADLAGIGPKDMGVAQNNNIQNGAFAYSALMKGLDDYENTFKAGGGAVLPGARKDALDVARRNLQLQMKELYNLGVLNGPDLEIMDQILVSPTSVAGNAMDFLGISDLDKRIPANIAQVRKLMTDLIEPKLKAANIDIDALKPKAELSDDDFLKSLGLQ